MNPPLDLEFPADLEQYLPPDLWRKLSSGEPQRRLLIQALDRLRSLVYLISTLIPSNLAQEKIRQPVPGLVSGECLAGSLLFADVSGFTALSERLAVLGPEGAERLTGKMNEYFTAMLRVVASSGGILLKFAGDALLVYFPEQEHHQHALWAVRAGMRMLREIEGFSSIESAMENSRLRMKVGVSTGEFLAASIGSAKRMEYVILGDAVTQTMTAEGVLTGPGQLVINQTTADYLDPSFVLKDAAEGFYRVVLNPDQDLSSFEIKAEKRRARGAIPLDASPQALVAHMEETLAQIHALSPYIADELVERIIAHAQQRRVESEFLTASVLFCNFTGFDDLLSMWGKDGVSRVTHLLSAYFNTVSDIITRHGGIVARIDPYRKGTKLLALFGAPISHQDDPLRAVRTAFTMNVELTQLNERWQKKFAHHLLSNIHHPLIQHHIGITVGKTFAGQVGSSTRREYTVMGDDVNLSARLMGAAEAGQILISQSVKEKISDFFFFTALSPITVKGKQKAIPIFQVDGPRTDTLLNRVHQRNHIIGRDRQQAECEKVLRQILGGESAWLTIQGLAGIGKSHLADTLLQKAITQGARVLPYQCNSYNAEISYACWSGVLRSLTGITSADPMLLRKEKLQNLILDFELSGQSVPHLAKLVGLSPRDISDLPYKLQGEDVPDDDTNIFADIVSGKKMRRRGRASDELSQLELGVNLKVSQMGFHIPSKLTPKEQDQLLDALTKLLKQVLAQSPLVIFFEDAHWMDAASRSLLQVVHEQLSSEGLLIMLAQRPVENQSIPGKIITLERLDHQGTANLVADVLVSDLAQIVYQHSQGNPLLIHEITAWIQQTWQIQTAEVIEALQTSDVLQKMVLSSLKNLPEIHREIVRIGSVIGEEFRVGELQALLPPSVDAVTLNGGLHELVETRFISLVEAGIDPRYAFQQKVVRDVLYASLPFARRRELHTQLARYLIAPETQRSTLHAKVSAFLNTSAVNPAQDAKIVARHFEAAENWSQASHSSYRAAVILRAQGAYMEAIKTYDRALDCINNLPTEQIDLGVLALQREIFTGIGDAALLDGDYPRSIASYRKAMDLLPEGELSGGGADLTKKQALVLPMVGEADHAVEMLRKWLMQDPKRAQDPGATAILTWLLWRAGEPAAPEWIEKCRLMLPSEADPWSVGVDGLLDDLSGRWQEAIQKYRLVGQHEATAFASIRLGDQKLKAGDASGARSLYNEAAGLFKDQVEGKCGLALVHYRMAEALWCEQDIAATRDCINNVEAMLISCPAKIRDEARTLIVQALEKISGGSDSPWPDWGWIECDDRYKIQLLFTD